MTGVLLALEGIAGAGKSTMRDRLLEGARYDGVPLAHVGQFSWLSLEATRTVIELRAGRPARTAEQALRAMRRDLELHARHNLIPALRLGAVIADRLTLSTACLLALVHDLPVADCVRELAEVPAARADLTVLLTTPLELCHGRISDRATRRRFGEDAQTASRLAELFDLAVTVWTDTTGLPVLRHSCATQPDLAWLVAECRARLMRSAATTMRI
ncbi:hypothetical protein [Streptodolium elevatio]|uniref:Thymidylate kinase n=1 Tax=Streptodolium elevatio TaxID=3157996 RepID=A0ABV3DAB2_9ACTN